MRTTRGARFGRAPRPVSPVEIETVVVGAGQAGLALSHHLSRAGHEHVLLERGSVGQRWHERWDSLTLLSPNWMNRLPGVPAANDPDGFVSRTDVIAHLEAYARSFDAPVLEGLEVTRIVRRGASFHVETTGGSWVARSVVLATGDAAAPYAPFPGPPEIASLHSADYRRADLLPDGPLLVVGAGATGQQLALELSLSGRDVVLSVGRHSRAPRRYRGRDIFDWLEVLGDFDRKVDELSNVEAAKRVPLFPLSGANGGEDLGLDRLAALGITITGRLEGFDGLRAVFADDLTENVAAADARLVKVLRRIDAHPLARGTDGAHPAPLVLPAGPRTVDLDGFGAVVWATGFRPAYPFLQIDGALDRGGEIIQQHGMTRVSGLYVLGLAYQSRRSSHFIGGVGRDAETIARRIVARPVRRRLRRVGWRRTAAAALGALLLLPAASPAAVKRPRPPDVPFAETAMAPNGYQVYNDYASTERTYSSERAVVHYVVLGIDAPPLNDDDADGVPDYVELVGRAADRALDYYERRGFHAPLPDQDGPDARPDLYVTRFMPGTLGIAFPAAGAAGGAFAVVSNNLDPSAERSFASVHATVAHELFHLVQFSYFPAAPWALPPPWILEGTAAALETRVASGPRRPRVDTSAAPLVRGDGAEHRHTELRRPAAVAKPGQRAASVPPRAVPTPRRRAARRRGRPRRRRDLCADLGEAVLAGIPQVRRRARGRPRRCDRAGVRPWPHRTAQRPRRAARRALRPPGTAPVRQLFAHRHLPARTWLGVRHHDLPARERCGGRAAVLRRIAGRTSGDGRTTTFAVPAPARADPRLESPLLVVSNGGGRAVRYAVSAR